MPSLPANGLTIGYGVAGSGPPLIALHGATMTGGEELADLLPTFTAGHTTYLPDARGHGSTVWDVATGGFRTADLVDDLADLVDGLGLDAFDLFGFSMGGMTALAYAVRHPDRIRTLVVAGISPAREPRARVVRHLLDPARIDRDDPDWATRLEARHGPAQGTGSWRTLLPAIAADVATQDLLEQRDLRGISAPTLVSCGDRDPFVPVAQAAELARQVRAGRLLVVPGRGHDIVSGPAAELDAAVSAFYRSV
jgi:3-oxoadipate enol-lactonase / 4-carboxymuconolactone decarboxylase